MNMIQFLGSDNKTFLINVDDISFAVGYLKNDVSFTKVRMKNSTDYISLAMNISDFHRKISEAAKS